MSEERANELRAILRANRPAARNDTALRDAIARQDAAMRAIREPDSAFRREVGADGGPGVLAHAPLALGLGAFAAIVLTDGTEDLSWVRFVIATLVFWGIAWGGGLLVRSWCGG